MMISDSSDFFIPSKNDRSSHSAMDMQIGFKELIYSSPDSYCEIWKVDRAGRFRVYKCLKEDHRGDVVYEKLLKKEFEIGYSLSHNNICEVYSFTNLPQLGNCIEMEWVDGMSLANLLELKKLDRKTAKKIICEICDALIYIHSKQVIHRDLKPSNILITYNGGNVKLIDFGFSDTDSHSIFKSPVGTRKYASPELLLDEDVDLRTDIWSVGCLIKEMSPYCKDVARRCCIRDKSKRYKNAQEVKSAIESYGIKRFSKILMVIFMIAILGGMAYYLAKPNPIESPAISSDNQIFTETDTTSNQTIEPIDSEPIKDIKPSTKVITDLKPKQEQNSSKTENSSQEEIDEIFRQATEMFD